MEREGQIIACGGLFPYFEEKCGEVAAIAVSPDCRGQGQGDKLLGMLLFLCLKFLWMIDGYYGPMISALKCQCCYFVLFMHTITI